MGWVCNILTCAEERPVTSAPDVCGSLLSLMMIILPDISKALTRYQDQGVHERESMKPSPSAHEAETECRMGKPLPI